MNEYLSTGQLAEATDINKQTLRYYEREGLIPDPPRSENGYRHYPQDSIKRIFFIKQAQGLGFSLKEIKELMLLSTKKDEPCLHVHVDASSKIEIIKQKINELEKMKSALESMSLLCSTDKSVEDCHFLHTLWGIEGDCHE